MVTLYNIVGKDKLYEANIFSPVDNALLPEEGLCLVSELWIFPLFILTSHLEKLIALTYELSRLTWGVLWNIFNQKKKRKKEKQKEK